MHCLRCESSSPARVSAWSLAEPPVGFWRERIAYCIKRYHNRKTTRSCRLGSCQVASCTVGQRSARSNLDWDWISTPPLKLTHYPSRCIHGTSVSDRQLANLGNPGRHCGSGQSPCLPNQALILLLFAGRPSWTAGPKSAFELQCPPTSRVALSGPQTTTSSPQTPTNGHAVATTRGTFPRRKLRHNAAQLSIATAQVS